MSTKGKVLLILSVVLFVACVALFYFFPAASDVFGEIFEKVIAVFGIFYFASMFVIPFKKDTGEKLFSIAHAVRNIIYCLIPFLIAALFAYLAQAIIK
ncbi:MAG: hypothetical protein IKI35_05600 [Stomatobaculum sp.]|nr:hypothetical protein [Stomatobaculum sp.]MBR7058183.1 hypothetical protein [Stomatobaculum sp.]